MISRRFACTIGANRRGRCAHVVGARGRFRHSLSQARTKRQLLRGAQFAKPKNALNCPFFEFSKSTSLAKRGVACRAPSAWGAHSACAGEYEQEKVRCCRPFCFVFRPFSSNLLTVSGPRAREITTANGSFMAKALSGTLTEIIIQGPIVCFSSCSQKSARSLARAQKPKN